MKLMIGVAALSVMAAGTATAQTQSQTVTETTNMLNKDGSVSYESHSVTHKGPAVPGEARPSLERVPVTFYYYDPQNDTILAADDLTEEIFMLWDQDSNRVLNVSEFADKQMVVYEPVEYSRRTYQDIDNDGRLELTREEYTFRLQQLPYYQGMKVSGDVGLTASEFTGVGFQQADVDKDGYVSYDELYKAFYGQERFSTNPALYNR